VVAIIFNAESFNSELPDVIYRQTNQKIEPVRKKLADLKRQKWV
jgi:hypothetical protein